MQSIWTRIEDWLSVNAPSLLETLSSGASEAEIEFLESRLSIHLPEDVKASYRIHDGQTDIAGSPFLYGYEFNSLESIFRGWEIEQQIDSEIQAIHGDDHNSSRAWNSGWIPLATEIGGNHYCLDLDSIGSEQVGSIIGVARMEDARPILAPSFRVWLEGFADALESGEYVFAAAYKGIISAEELAEYEEIDL
jgi:cell wall assembly regulator SMI1